MFLRRLLGKDSNGNWVWAHYRHEPGQLPELKVRGKSWRGSSLGPSSHEVRPDAAHVDYWRHLAREWLAATDRDVEIIDDEPIEYTR